MDTSLIIRFVIYFLSIFLKLFYYALLIWVLLSWFSASKNQLGVLLDQIVEPVLRPFRWARIGMFDLSPIVALITLEFVATKLTQYLQTFL